MLPKAIQMLIYKISGTDALHAESIALSLIDINLISVSDRGHLDPVCREKIIDYLGRKDFWKSIDKLFIDTLGSRGQEFQYITWAEKTDVLQGKRSIITDCSHRIFGSWCYFNPVQGLYLDLQESVTLDKDAAIDRDFFAYFFAFRLSKKDPNAIHNFLIVTFTKHFGSEIMAFVDFCRHEIISKYQKLLGKARIEMIRSFIKKIQKKAPYVKTKTIQIKVKALNEFFTADYDGFKSAEQFRVYVVHRLLEDDGQPVKGLKRKLRLIVDLLTNRKIWKSDLENGTIADTLKKEFRLPTLSYKVFQGESTFNDSVLEERFNKINWAKSEK